MLRELNVRLNSVGSKIQWCLDTGMEVPETLEVELDNAQTAVREYLAYNVLGKENTTPTAEIRHGIHERLAALWPRGTTELGQRLLLSNKDGGPTWVYVFRGQDGRATVSVGTDTTLAFFDADRLTIQGKHGLIFLYDGAATLVLVP